MTECTAMANDLRITADWLRQPSLQKLLSVLSRQGHEARIVGGAVRNHLLGKPVGDIDVATTMLPEEVMRVVAQAGFDVYPTGIDHGTVTVVSIAPPRSSYEVTTLRSDVETDGRRAVVAFSRQWRADAGRRDFTINALYCDHAGTLYDPLGGLADIEGPVIRFAGDPDQRIREDYLRILRFFRFEAAYGSGTLAPEALEACVRQRHGLAQLSGERIRQELCKLLVAPGVIRAVGVMGARDILQTLGMLRPNLRRLKAMTEIDQAYGEEPDALLRLVAVAGQQEEFFRSLMLSGAQQRRIKEALKTPAPLPRLRLLERKILIYQLGRQRFSDAVRLGWSAMGAQSDPQGWRSLLELARTWSIPEFSVTGKDLLKCGIVAGPEMGVLLRHLEDWWMAAGFPDDKSLVLAQLDKFRET